MVHGAGIAQSGAVMNVKSTLLAVAAAIVSPVQLTVAEFQDKYDTSPTTAFQPDLLIGAWGQWFVICIILFVGSNAVKDAKEAKDILQSNNLTK